jgi:hypothetical protein
MANNISGYGLQVSVRASITFPSGFTVTQFADDADPFDFPSIQVADKAMGLNGDLVTWSTANPLIVTINVIPGSDDDRNLATLLEANRAGKGKIPARDVITMTATYPNNTTKQITNGAITDGLPGNAVASSQRLKSKSYSFAFENQGAA